MPEIPTLTDEQKQALHNHLNNLHKQAKSLQFKLLEAQRKSKKMMDIAIPLHMDYVSIQKEIELKKNNIVEQLINFLYR